MKKQVLLFVMMLMPLMASADPVEIDGIYYNLVKKIKQAEVTYSGTAGQYNGDIVIPEVLTYEGVSYSVTSIGESAFFGCSSLTGVSIPNSVTNIGNSAFCNCKAITSIMIPNSVTSIDGCAFIDCTGLTSITIGNGVTSIGENAFNGCTGLSLVNIKDIAAWCNITFGSGESNPLFHAHHLFLDSIEIKNLVIPNNVTCIGERAFEYCSYLTSVTIPNSVTSIGREAFYACSSMTSLEIPNSVTSIGGGAFSYCKGLTSVDIPNSVISLDAFSYCTGLTSVDIPNSVTSLGGFCGCSGLTSVTIPNSVTSIGGGAFSGCSSLTDISIPNSVTSIGEYAFEGCSGLTSITIGNGVTSIGGYAFYNCSELTTVTIPNSVNSIENFTFYGCTSLESIIIGKGVNNIGYLAFANCKELIEVTCLAPNVPAAQAAAFKNSMIEYATLYVLRSANDYRNTEPWSGFGNIVSFTPVYKLTYVLDGEEYKVMEYEEGENITPEPDPMKEGYFFSGWSDIPETMPAYDVTVTGSFLLTPICATPTITILPNGKIKVESATEGATCVTNITASNAEPLTDGEIGLSTPLIVYTVTSYATKEGYNDSEVATATFRYEMTEGDMNGDGMLNITDVIHLVNMILGQ